MSSKVQLCNIALARIGAATIVSFSDNTREAELCNLLFDDTAEGVMAEGAWTSTINRAELAKLTTAPVWGFTSQFQLPTNPRLIRMISLNEHRPGDFDFRIEGDKLLIDLNTIKIEYIGFIDDTQSYDAYLKQAVISKMAFEMSFALSVKPALADALFQRYRFDVRNGLANDGKQGSGIQTRSGDLLDVRNNDFAGIR